MFICPNCNLCTDRPIFENDKEWGDLILCPRCGKDMETAIRCDCGKALTPDKYICDDCREYIIRKTLDFANTAMAERQISKRNFRKVMRETL